MNSITPTPSTRDRVISVVAVLLSLGFFGLGLASSYVYPTLSPIFMVCSTVGSLFLAFLQVFPRFTLSMPVLHFRLIAKPLLIFICILSISLNVFTFISKEISFNPPIPNTTPTTESTSSTVPARKPLYSADWSKGPDGWMHGTTIGEWSISNGMLNNSGSMLTNPFLLAPQIQSPSTNYVVDASIQYNPNDNTPPGTYAFGIIVGNSGGNSGYACYISGSQNQSINIAEVTDNSLPQYLDIDTTLAPSVSDPIEDTQFYTYRVAVHGTQITFSILDANQKSSGANQKSLTLPPIPNDLPLQNTYIGIIDNSSPISVSNFEVTAS